MQYSVRYGFKLSTNSTQCNIQTIMVFGCDYSFGSFPFFRLEEVHIDFLNIWIESRSWIEGKVFIHLVLLYLCASVAAVSVLLLI